MAKAMHAAAAPGVTEAEVYAAGMAAASRLGCQACMLMWSGPGFVAWGPPSWSYRPEPPRVLRSGDVLLAEVVSRFGMKETEHQVAIAIGDPHPDIETAAAIARASYTEGLRAARVGNSFGDLAEAMLAPLKQAGSWPIHPLVRALNPFGHVVGIRAQRGHRRPVGEPRRHRGHRRGRHDRARPLHHPAAPRLARMAVRSPPRHQGTS
jgi:Xaa-Pro aminopeptidase